VPAEAQSDAAPAPRVGDLVDALDAIAPPDLAEPWDNVGLLIGDRGAGLAGVLLCIDLTRDVLAEAVRRRADAVVAYHPPIFKGLKRLVPGEIAYEAVRAGIAVHSPHTALDKAAGGTNDVLADLLYLTDRRPLRPEPAGEDDAVKLVVYVPEPDADHVAEAIFDAGAGRIGGYDRCSFRLSGTGTFRGGEGTNPAIGQVGELERVEEVRLETVVPDARLAGVLAAMRRAHPYEEVAFDLFPRRAEPARLGLGRIGDFEEPVPREVVIGRVRRELGVSDVLVAGPLGGEVRRVAVCAGSCGELLDEAARQGAEFYLTGELKHHDALRAARLGMTVACVLHSNSERPTLEVLRRRLASVLPDSLEVAVAEGDVDPFRVV